MLTRALLPACRRLLDQTRIPLAVSFSNGTRLENSSGPAAVEILYKTPGAELNSLVFGKWGLIESYINQTVDINGDLRLLIRAASQSGPDLAESHRRNSYPLLIRVRNFLHELRHGNRSVRRGIENARAHYDRGTEMFGQYLDPTRTYTCAYWEEGARGLVDAQQNKLAHVCRKLRLSPGESLVDVGGGWGSLLIYACETYGVRGVNCCPVRDQNKWLEEEIARRGLAGRLTIEEKDFRQVRGPFDKYVSLGVYEHAGRRQLADWVRSMAHCLRPGGIGVLHFIAHDIPMDTDFFIRKHIFPGGYLPGLSETVALMARNGLEILDIENLRRHYALTLDAWAANFQANWEQIHAVDPALFDERFRRTWLAYLNFCAEFFRVENAVLRLYQITFSKGNTETYPMDRGFLYRQESAGRAGGSAEKNPGKEAD
jgi:cyclopropane-fatty-acyl-phospholipid synthase